MGGITVPAVEDYLYSMLPARDEVLTHIEDEAAKRDIPIVGPAVGRILYQLALMIGAKNVFELGSAIGYSTIWWARAVGEGGRVIYTDGDRKKAEEARGYFGRAGVIDRITLTPVTRSNFFQSRKMNTTSSSTTSTKKTIPGYSNWHCRTCAKVDCSLPTTFSGVGK